MEKLRRRTNEATKRCENKQQNEFEEREREKRRRREQKKIVKWKYVLVYFLHYLFCVLCVTKCNDSFRITKYHSNKSCTSCCYHCRLCRCCCYAQSISSPITRHFTCCVYFCGWFSSHTHTQTPTIQLIHWELRDRTHDGFVPFLELPRRLRRLRCPELLLNCFTPVDL